jgi:hypothetical protein
MLVNDGPVGQADLFALERLGIFYALDNVHRLKETHIARTSQVFAPGFLC